MAQDLRAAFGLGKDEKHISTVDSEGVVLAAIQVLYLEKKQKVNDCRSGLARSTNGWRHWSLKITAGISACWELAKASRGRPSNLASALTFLAQPLLSSDATGFAGQILL